MKTTITVSDKFERDAILAALADPHVRSEIVMTGSIMRAITDPATRIEALEQAAAILRRARVSAIRAEFNQNGDDEAERLRLHDGTGTSGE